MLWLLAVCSTSCLGLNEELLIANSHEEMGVRRVHAHLLIDDPVSALNEAIEQVNQFPDSEKAKKTLVEAYAANGFEEKAIDLWNQMAANDPSLLYDRNLLEELAWGVLKKGCNSTQYGVRLASTIGAYLTRDVRAVPILIKMMRDSNAVIRSVACQMASGFGDAPLKDEIVRLFFEEKVWVVRLEVIRAVGALKIKSLKEKLEALVQSEKTCIEERFIAINALISMLDDVSFAEIKTLSQSNRAGLRHLACSIAAHFQVKEAKEIIINLIQDSNPAVRIAAINAFALYYREKDISPLKPVLNDSDPTVAITASWAVFLIDPEVGKKHMAKWLKDSLPENRRMAAAALSLVGQKGTALALEIIKTSQDVYVLVNLAVGLIGQRVESLECAGIIYDFLHKEKRMLMVDKRPNPLFDIIAPSQVRYNDQVPNYPEAKDQMTRLNMVSLITLVEHPKAIDALKGFLQRKSWGVSGVAAATILHEGDESALDLVKQLVDDPDPNISLQACLVLAMFGKDESVLTYLQGAYPGSDNERKLHILEAIGQIGNAHSYSFLVSVLREPFPILRVAAASALIQSVNH